MKADQYQAEDPTIVAHFQAEVRAFVNQGNNITIVSTNFLGEEEGIEIQLGSLRALGEFLVRLADKEGV